MALFQGVEVRVQSGSAGTTMMAIERLQNVSIPIDIQRAQIRTLNKFRPEINMPVMNYTPVPISLDYIKSDNVIENAIGLINSTGVICGIMNARSSINYGMRNFEVLHSPLESPNYIGQFNIQSGVLNSYSVAASVGDFARTSIGYQCLDIGFAANTSAKTGSNYSVNAIRGQDVSIGGISLSGFGVSGFTTQSFNLGITISRNEVTQIGSKFPVDRPIIDASASIQLQGFIEGGNTSLTGLGSYDCGLPVSGVLTITLTPSCGAGNATTYRIVNPYFQSINQSYSVGNFASVDMNFIVPLTPSASETGSASNLIIS